MTQRLLVAVIAILIGLAPALARAQDRTKGPGSPKAKPPATLEQRIADLEAQAAKLMKEVQALRDEVKATRAPADEDITIFRLKNAEAVRLAKLLDELLRGKNDKDLRILADPATNS